MVNYEEAIKNEAESLLETADKVWPPPPFIILRVLTNKYGVGQCNVKASQWYSSHCHDWETETSREKSVYCLYIL